MRSTASRTASELVLRFKVAEQDEMSKGFDIHHQVKERQREVDRRLEELGAKIIEETGATEYAFRYRIEYEGDRRRLANYIEDVEGAEILSIGHGLELIKDLGDAARVAEPIQAARLHRAPMPSAIPAWRPNPMSISARPIPIGPIPSPTSPWSTTASSPTTGTAAGHWSGAAIASCRTAIPS